MSQDSLASHSHFPHFAFPCSSFSTKNSLNHYFIRQAECKSSNLYLNFGKSQCGKGSQSFMNHHPSAAAAASASPVILFLCGRPWMLAARLLLFFLLSLQSLLVASEVISPSASPPTPPSKTTDKSSSRGIVIIVSSVSAALVGLIVILMALFMLMKLLKLRRKSQKIVSRDPESSLDKAKICDEGANRMLVKRFSWVEIEKMTEDFSQVIGLGGFSKICLGSLYVEDSSSVVAAIKVLNQNLKQELDVLLHVHHDNIVKLLGFCNDDQDKSALIFEYVPNGNLQERLHGTEQGSGVSWKSRIAIAYQLASAIEHLHERCTPHIVHGDIKASNILLDENFNCKLCDFGSAKMGFSAAIAASHPSRKQVMMGSPGYMDPFYFRTGISSKKNDIYSYGVILLELITGMEAFCTVKNQMLTSVATGVLIGSCGETKSTHVAEIVDPRLDGKFELEEAQALASISVACLHTSPSLRPSAADILQTMTEKLCSLSFQSSSC